MASSAARVLRSNQIPAPGENVRCAKIIPFPSGRAEPLLEQHIRSAAGMSAPSKSSGEKETACQGLKLEKTREAKAKGQTRRAEALPDSQYLIAWIVWFAYVRIMLGAGIRAGSASKPSDFHEQLKKGR